MLVKTNNLTAKAYVNSRWYMLKDFDGESYLAVPLGGTKYQFYQSRAPGRHRKRVSRLAEQTV